MRRVLVVGGERTGTTWISRALASCPGGSYVHEPDNPDSTPAARHARAVGLYPVLRPGDHHPSYEADWDLAFAGGFPRTGLTVGAGRALRRAPDAMSRPVVAAATAVLQKLRPRPGTVVVKSVHCMFSIGWLLDRYDPELVLVRRNPLGVVSSLLELGTTEAHLSKLYRLYADPAVRAQVVEPLGLPDPRHDLSLAEKCAWWVGLEDATVLAAKRSLDKATLVVHDQICGGDPLAGFRRLFSSVGLEWSREVDEFLARSDRPGEGFSTERVTRSAPERWREHLGEDEAAVRRVVEMFPAGELTTTGTASHAG